MAATRKLQIEIERTLKKVQQALDEFRGTWEKMDDASEISKKEKCEGELKKEIKRLQRDREQIRSWLTSQEGLAIKAYRDGLESVKKDIEAEMERFKILEKSLKVKAFSKEGLILQPHIDPQEQAKMDAVHFLNKALDSLQLLIDTCEAEVETKSAGKGAKKAQPRILELDTQISKHKWHRTKLEQILRLLANEETSTEDVDFLKDSLDYYIQSHQDGDIADFFHDDALYDSFPFDRLSMSQREIGEDVISHTHSLPILDSIEEEDMAPTTPKSSTEGFGNPLEVPSASRSGSGVEKDLVDEAARREVDAGEGDMKESPVRKLFKSPGLDDLATLQNGDNALPQTDQEMTSPSPPNNSPLKTFRPPSLPTSPIRSPRGSFLKYSPESSSPTHGSGSGVGRARNRPIYLPPHANVAAGNRPLASQVVRGGDPAAQSGSGLKPLPPKSLLRQFPGISPSQTTKLGQGREDPTPNTLSASVQPTVMQRTESGSGTNDDKASTENVASVFEKLSKEPSMNEVPTTDVDISGLQSVETRGLTAVPSMTTSHQLSTPKRLLEDVSREEGEIVTEKQERTAPSPLWGGPETIIERSPNEAHIGAATPPSHSPRAPSTSTSSPISNPISNPTTWNLEQRVQEHHQRMQQRDQELPSFTSLGFKAQERPSLPNSQFLHDRTFLSRPPHTQNESTNPFAPLQQNQSSMPPQFQTRFTPQYLPHPPSLAHQFPLPDVQRYNPLDFDWSARSLGPPHTNERTAPDPLQSEEGVGGDQSRTLPGWQPLNSRFRHVEMQTHEQSQGEPSNFPTFDPMLELEQLGITFKDTPKDSPFNKEEVIACLARGATHLDTSREEVPESTTGVTQLPTRPCQVPNSWPHHPITPEHAPALFKRLNTESLFFAYYFQQKSYAQFLATKELKGKSWRYHKQYRTWFQRHAEPVEVKEEFERGSYLYFDFELHREKDMSGWCQKIKPNMMFEYRFLEEELKL